jgi:hypothetical protein
LNVITSFLDRHDLESFSAHAPLFLWFTEKAVTLPSDQGSPLGSRRALQEMAK